MTALEAGVQPTKRVAELDKFREPIEFIYQEHARLRACCEQLVELSDNLESENATTAAASILDYLENELPLHLADEQEDLFRLLRRRSSSDDNIVSVLKLLCVEHQQDIECGDSLLESLRLIAGGGQPLDRAMFRDYVRAYAMLQRRHHAMENNEVLPLAFERLTSEDMVELRRKMTMRRGLLTAD